MSDVQSSQSPTRTSPARPPDGWWLNHPRYRSYMLFSSTGLVLVVVAAILMRSIAVLGEGAAAWDAHLANLALPISLLINVILFLATCFFSVRFLSLGPKVFSVPIGPFGALPAPVWIVLLATPAVLVPALILLIMWGVIL